VCYPGMTAAQSQNPVPLEINTLRAIISPVADWQKQNNIPSNRIIAEEFGCHRTNCGAAEYLSDLIHIFNAQEWHWAFYSFREDTWDGMDYEIGDQPLAPRFGKPTRPARNPPRRAQKPHLGCDPQTICGRPNLDNNGVIRVGGRAPPLHFPLFF